MARRGRPPSHYMDRDAYVDLLLWNAPSGEVKAKAEEIAKRWAAEGHHVEAETLRVRSMTRRKEADEWARKQGYRDFKDSVLKAAARIKLHDRNSDM